MRSILRQDLFRSSSSGPSLFELRRGATPQPPVNEPRFLLHARLYPLFFFRDAAVAEIAERLYAVVFLPCTSQHDALASVF